MKLKPHVIVVVFNEMNTKEVKNDHSNTSAN